MTALCVLLNYLMPRQVIEILLSLVTSALVLIWATIVATHLKFRARMRAGGRVSAFPALFAPWSNYLCLAFLGMVVVVLWIAPDTRHSVYAIPLWIIMVYAAWRLRPAARLRSA